MNAKRTTMILASIMLTLPTLAFVDDKKDTDKKTTPKTATTKTKKKAICCESGIPARFAAAGAKVLKKDKPVTAAHK